MYLFCEANPVGQNLIVSMPQKNTVHLRNDRATNQAATVSQPLSKPELRDFSSYHHLCRPPLPAGLDVSASLNIGQLSRGGPRDSGVYTTGD